MATLNVEKLKNTKKVLDVVDEALRKYGRDMLSVDISQDGKEMFEVNICARHWSDCYMSAIVKKKACYLRPLRKGLDERDVGYCGW